MQVEDVAGEADFNTLTRWLMINTKDKELGTTHHNPLSSIVITPANAPQ